LNLKYHQLSLIGITGILFGSISIAYIAILHLLVKDYVTSSSFTSVIPISYLEYLQIGMTFLYILISLLIITYINKKRRLKFKILDGKLTNNRMLLNITLIALMSFCFYLLLFKGFIKYIAATSLLFYGIINLFLNNFSIKYRYILGTLFICTGIITLLFPPYKIFLWGLSFGGFHILFGLLNFLLPNSTKV
jgi:hypothetical protein